MIVIIPEVSDKGEFKQVAFYAFSPPLLPHLTRLGHQAAAVDRD